MHSLVSLLPEATTFISVTFNENSCLATEMSALIDLHASLCYLH